MKNMFYKSLFLCMILAPYFVFSKDVEKFHICTVASNYGPGLERLLTSCDKFGIQIDILGFNQPYKRNVQKITYVLDYIRDFPNDHIVLFLDGFDTLILKSKEEILDTFLNFNTPFVISSERNCWPVVGLVDFFPASPTSFRYLNSGVFMGYVGQMKHILKGVKKLDTPNYKSDQRLFSLYFVYERFPFMIDQFSELALSLFLVENKDVQINKKNQTLRCMETNSFPCIIHSNSLPSPIYERAYKILIQGNIL